MDKFVIENIIRRFDFTKDEIEDLKLYKGLTYVSYNTDKITRRNVERMIENICNCILDIGKIILSQNNIQMPGSYRDVLHKLGEANIIDNDLAGEMAEIIGLRNILSHQYLDIKWQYISNFIEANLEKVELFLMQVEKIISLEIQ